MSPRLKILIIVVIAALVIGGAVFVFVQSRKVAPAAGGPAETAAPQTLAPEPLKSDLSFGEPAAKTKEAAPVGEDDVALARLAATYGEMFGSYSTAEPYRNLQDLIPFMTASMAEWAASVMAKAAPEEAVNVVTRVVGSKLLSKEASRATFSLNAQRAVEKAASEPGAAGAAVQYQTLEVALANVGGEWKLASAFWK